MNANVKNTAKVNAKTTTKVTKVNVQKTAKATKVTEKKTGKVVTYLADGITGKKMMNLIIDANAAHKQDGKSFSFCVKRAIEFGEDVFAGIREFNVTDLTPKNLIPLRTEKNALKTGFSVWEVYGLIKKFYAAKDAK